MSEVTRVKAGDGDVAVKTFAAHDRERAEREAAILRHLRGGSSTCRVQTLVALDGVVMTTRWLEGTKKVYTEISEEEWRALGAELAALHDRLEGLGYALPSLETTFDVEAERAAIEAQRARAPDVRAYLDARVALLGEHAAAALAAPPSPSGPIHNDYNQHNYLFDGALPPIVVDWDRAIRAPREYEVVRCLNHLPLVARAHAAAFVGGYREVRALDRAALAWAVHRTLVEHARKAWPLERWLANPGDAAAEAALRGSMEIVRALHEDATTLEAFYR